MPKPDPPQPWKIADGPTPLPQGLIDGRAWLFTLERDGAERPLIVGISDQALTLGRPETLPVETRDAITTDGRSEAAKVAQFDDPTNCVVLGQNGYLPMSPALSRLARQ
jgi:Mg-chelatase subunit ChlD